MTPQDACDLPDRISVAQYSLIESGSDFLFEKQIIIQETLLLPKATSFIPASFCWQIK